MTYEIRARYERCEYFKIDEADTEERAEEKAAEYRAHFPAGWRVWCKKVEGKAFHPQRFV